MSNNNTTKYKQTSNEMTLFFSMLVALSPKYTSVPKLLMFRRLCAIVI